MKGSIIYQFKTVVKDMDRIGKSKVLAKRLFGETKGVHSVITKNELEKTVRNFTEWVREKHDVKRLVDIDEKHYREYLEVEKRHTKTSTKRTYESTLRLFQKGYKNYCEKNNLQVNEFVTEKRLISNRERSEGVSNRSMPNDNIKVLKSEISSNSLKSADLMHNMGFRVEETTKLLVSDVDFKKGVINVTRDTAKGGRPRKVPIPKNFEGRLKEIIKGKESAERLVPIRPGTVSDNLRKVAQRNKIYCPKSERENPKGRYTGTHALRHTYSRNERDRIMTSSEREMLNRCLNNYKDNKNFDYGIKKHERSMYNSMKSKVDEIHKSLGHGENRFDLALRYLAD